MNYEKIVTLYDTAAHASQARRSLEGAGFPASEISTLTSAVLNMSADKLSDLVIWRHLFGREIDQREATAYARVVGDGGSVLTVRVPESDVAKALAILNTQRAIDLQHGALQEGVVSASAPTAPTEPAATLAEDAASGEEILGLAEEKLEIGKRVVREGTTRIRRFVVETPVEQEITLHEEHVRVIRRVISKPESGRNIDWAEKTLEIDETIEEPVITKSAHLTEEVVIQRESANQVKTVREKVRRQQVEVEHIPGAEPTVKK